jgi:uncharacterized protein (DUF58 family)
VLTPQEVSVLDGLAYGAFGTAASPHASGSRAVRARGFGLEFHDFRHYQPGDDPRYIDWTVQARLRQLVVKEFRAEGHLRVHLILDTSRSMAAGAPDKLSCAKKLAALLAYVAVRRGEAFGVATFDESVRDQVLPTAGRTQWHRVLDTLDAAHARGVSATTRALVDYGSRTMGPGLAIVISDFFDEQGAFEGLQYLAHRRLMPVLVQVVAPQELDPPIDEDAELVDLERPGVRGTVVDRDAVLRYKERLARHTNELAEFCASHDMTWSRVTSSMSFAELLQACIDAGLLAGRG